MTTDDVIVILKHDNKDLILVRISGAVRVVKLDDSLQGKLNWLDCEAMISAAAQCAKEKANA